MANMFDENFSFESPRSPSTTSSSATRESSRSVSPCSAASPFPPPRLSVTDLAVQFAGQRLRKEATICYEPCDAYANTDGDEDGWAIPSLEDSDGSRLLSRSRTYPRRAQSPSRRMQRQVNTRLLCSTSHHRDIAALVSRMVESSDQCSIAPPGSLTPTHEDEGYSSDNDEQMSGLSASRRPSLAMSKSRSDLRRGSRASVSKDVRFRKNEKCRRIRSSEGKQ
ncbi:uncharacterized protein LTR77_004102 [Saxophila tyrrhenica]|uniref:Uncharacterized protein n=1 Tax=Saxophila tyrrhenica TaxID=1690608 RepID=A0AAV9PCK0_9PEZI|nr:hypothetical protein LTR77_004102 [Saxophila tyrrhenica]